MLSSTLLYLSALVYVGVSADAKPHVKVGKSAIEEYALEADGIRATFVPLGARLKSLRVPDSSGEWREVNLGYDDAQAYADEETPTYFGAVIGRYANRIRNGTFAVDGVTSRIPTNEHDGRNSLHGGTVGYDAREWSVVSHNATTVTFSLMDYGFEGFPGNVFALASYTLTPGRLTTVLTAHALDKPTPIMLTTHSFFNLGGDTGVSVLDDELEVGASRFVAVDGIAVPTGELVNVATYAGDEARHPLNFTSNQPIRQSLAAHLCGDGCAGLDNCFLLDHTAPSSRVSDLPAMTWSSPSTGIRMRLHTNQPAVQLYACAANDGSVTTSIGPAGKYGCMAVEPQGWIDAISHPEWMQDQIYSPGDAPFVNVAEYRFDTVAAASGKRPLATSRSAHEEL